MLRSTLLALSRNEQLRQLVTDAPMSKTLVERFVAGDRVDEAVRVSRELSDSGRLITIGRLGEDIDDVEGARATRDAYLTLLDSLDDAGLGGRAEVSVKLSALGRALRVDGEGIARDFAAEICAKATSVGTTITLDMEDHTTADSTLTILRDLRVSYPATGAVLQAALRRTESDCRDLADTRVRLCKGAYSEPASVAFQDKRGIDLAYVRCMKILFAGSGYPMLATHDPRLVDIAGALAVSNRRALGTYEFQMLYGIRPEEQLRLASQGERLRVYLPYGDEWFGYLMRRLLERPANLLLLARLLTSKG